ncbi:single-stranded DNA-binding protein [Bacillus pseudomycoides]|uniref:Single-stranded DNA-binding protein n=1 Tax=Bacillus pseudomycoides TaxID=64104 RepID=A0A2C3PTF6_9BACI|nr:MULTISPECIES: ERF family protein [Bacillus]PEJ72517.1 single-stranded DNA-binding protein [Bacillus pseudomycoides]PEM73291.1 single-stranded DNA-binding protein [Bacillus pseudomycoides]PEP61139.1 single-stranded DNA-binding protein [Bacillus pseudomycoides]PFW68007.1 single-stranded DNA-binding protein [Bacillus pseudomycoides]PFZ47355.1 single-stranded DNA-binding protein [Bacillus pseudomycoides]
MNLWQKLVAIRKDIDVFVKNGKSYGYDYVTGSQILHKIKNNMDELQVILMPKMGEHKTWQYSYKSKKGKDTTDFVIEGDGFYEWINAEKPEERETIPWKFFGQQDDISKAYGSALTYSERYFLLKFFGVPTDEDDADAKEPAPKQSNNNYSNQTKPNNKQRENLPLPANATEGSEIILSFGKYEGKTLREIFKENKGYLEWIVKNNKADDRIKTAINMMFQAAQQSA